MRVEVAANERRLMLFLHFVRDERDGQIAIFSRQRPVTATEDELFKFDDEKTTFFLRPRKGNVFRFDGFLLRKNADSILAARRRPLSVSSLCRVPELRRRLDSLF